MPEKQKQIKKRTGDFNPEVGPTQITNFHKKGFNRGCFGTNKWHLTKEMTARERIKKERAKNDKKDS